MAHSMKKMRRKTGFFAIKVDLSKAYDKHSWHFIRKVLMEVGLPFNMIELIMPGVTSVCSNVNWHGRRTDFFHPLRGIRQGDPISPYLFVMCMDKLSHLISQKVEEGSWKGLRAGTKWTNYFTPYVCG